jgi:hypothetical protein
VTTGEYPLLYVFLLLGDLVRVDVSGGERESLFFVGSGQGGGGSGLRGGCSKDLVGAEGDV